ncbi:hypothetical protein [Nonomuraea sp. GTA35]|uniref:hypothetical protein n=1 Tax=Nonomuraea sp. GTA35 TaxID=1676746 RepID=UPI0035BFF926
MTGPEQAFNSVTVRPAEADPLETAVEITIRISSTGLARTSDQHLAALWHAIQAAPADFEHSATGHVAEHIGREIIRRWLRAVDPELWRQQGDHYSHKQLCRFAKWNGQEWVLRDEAFQAEVDRRNETADSGTTP